MKTGLLAGYKNKAIYSPGIASLYTSRSILIMAGGFVGLFLPVFLLQHYHSLEKTIFFYFWTWLAYLMLAAVGSKIMNFFGVRKSMIYSFPFLILFYLSLYFFTTDVLVWSVVAGLSLTAYRMLYWVPYHTEMAKFSRPEVRGKQLAVLDSFSTLLGIFIPLISGFLISRYGFEFVFVIVIILILTALLPLKFVPPVTEKFSWSYKKTWQEFWAKKNRQMMWAYIGEGAENWIGGVLWPIFLWQLLNGQYFTVGLLASGITLMAVFLNLIIGNYTDKFDKRKLLRAGSILYSLGWISKAFITTAFQIFIVSTYHSFALILLRSPFNALVYESTADSGHYIDEYSTLREMYQQFGRLIVMVIILVMLQFVSFNLVFVIGAIAALLVNLLPKSGLYEKAFNF